VRLCASTDVTDTDEQHRRIGNGNAVVLTLACVIMRAQLPMQLSRLTALTSLVLLDSPELTGTVPDAIASSLTSLHVLNISQTAITGTISAAWFANVRTLVCVRVSHSLRCRAICTRSICRSISSLERCRQTMLSISQR
jgi:hypothetical protein